MIELLNHVGEPVADDVTALQVDVVPGLYQVRATSAYSEHHQFIRIETRACDVSLSPLSLVAATIPNSANKQPPGINSALDKLNRHRGANAPTGQLMLSVTTRGWEQATAPPPHPRKEIHLFSFEGERILIPWTAWSETVHAANSWNGCVMALPPGDYRLRITRRTGGRDAARALDRDDERIEQIVHLSAGWQTQTFLVRHAARTAFGPRWLIDLSRTATTMAPIDRGFVLDDVRHRRSEQARWALEGHRVPVALALAQGLSVADEPFTAVMLAACLAQATNRETTSTKTAATGESTDAAGVTTTRNSSRAMAARDNAARVNAVRQHLVDALVQILPHHPDVVVLRMANSTSAAGNDTLAEIPPMLLASWGEALRVNRTRGGTMPPHSLSVAIGDRLYACGAWLAWDARGLDPVLKRRPATAATPESRVGAISEALSALFRRQPTKRDEAVLGNEVHDATQFEEQTLSLLEIGEHYVNKTTGRLELPTGPDETPVAVEDERVVWALVILRRRLGDGVALRRELVAELLEVPLATAFRMVAATHERFARREWFDCSDDVGTAD